MRSGSQWLFRIHLRFRDDFVTIRSFCSVDDSAVPGVHFLRIVTQPVFTAKIVQLKEGAFASFFLRTPRTTAFVGRRCTCHSLFPRRYIHT